jgi:hypothetical protein
MFLRKSSRFLVPAICAGKQFGKLKIFRQTRDFLPEKVTPDGGKGKNY